MNLSVAIPWLLTLVTVGAGIWQFTTQQRQANRQPFLQKQLELSFEATEAVARLATETNPEEWEKARGTFWKLYWGPLSIVEDPEVESAMVDLGELIPSTSIKSQDLPMEFLQVPSYRLAHAVRELVLSSWQISLPPLDENRHVVSISWAVAVAELEGERSKAKLCTSFLKSVGNKDEIEIVRLSYDMGKSAANAVIDNLIKSLSAGEPLVQMANLKEWTAVASTAWKLCAMVPKHSDDGWARRPSNSVIRPRLKSSDYTKSSSIPDGEVRSAIRALLDDQRWPEFGQIMEAR
jgi:hypothetical protein